MPDLQPSPIEKITKFLLAEPDLARGRNMIEPHESLVASGLIDSVGVLKLVGFIEEEFNVSLEAEEVNMDTFDTIASIAHLLEKRYDT